MTDSPHVMSPADTAEWQEQRALLPVGEDGIWPAPARLSPDEINGIMASLDDAHRCGVLTAPAMDAARLLAHLRSL